MLYCVYLEYVDFDRTGNQPITCYLGTSDYEVPLDASVKVFTGNYLDCIAKAKKGKKHLIRYLNTHYSNANKNNPTTNYQVLGWLDYQTKTK